MTLTNAHQGAKEKALLSDVYRWAAMRAIRTHYQHCTTRSFKELCGDTYEQCIQNFRDDPTLASRVKDHDHSIGKIFEDILKEDVANRERVQQGGE